MAIVYIPRQTQKGRSSIPKQDSAWRVYRQIFCLSDGTHTIQRIASLMHWQIEHVQTIVCMLIEYGYMDLQMEEYVNMIDVASCRESWAMIGNGLAQELFLRRMYDTLFYKYPDVRVLFMQTDMEHQIKSLLATMHVALAAADKLETLSDPLKALGKRHKSKGVLKEYYPLVADALVETFRGVLREHFTPRMRQAWQMLLTVIAEKMIEGAEEN